MTTSQIQYYEDMQ